MSRRSRKRHVQLELPKPHVVDKNGQYRGGVRDGAGRKRKTPLGSSPHKARPVLDPRHPQHVTIRVAPAVGWLRRLDTYRAIRRALATVMANHGAFRIVHVSVQNTHIHLLCEASDRYKLAAGMQGFQISAARHINAAISRRRRAKRTGQVFTDRYHCEDIGSVRQARNAIAYVINNWRKHRDDRGRFTLQGGRLDPYASGLAFVGWREPLPSDDPLPRHYEPPPVSEPATWLLAHGWRRARPISVFEIPGPRVR
jgi:REP element-mobilizing transposase RayT